MEYEFGTNLTVVSAVGLKWVSKGDTVIFQEVSKGYPDDKGIWVLLADGTRHCINLDRVAPIGDDKAIALAEKNAPKLHVILQDSCSNYIAQEVGLEKAVKKASGLAEKNEDYTIYELTPVKVVSGTPSVNDA